MTRHRSRGTELRILSSSTLFLAVPAILLAFASPAPQAGTGQPFAKSSAAFLPAQANTPAQRVVPAWPTVGSPQRIVSRVQITPDESLSFLPAVAYNLAGRDSTSVVVADVNGDGKPDLVVASLAGPLSVLLGNGDGTFQPAMSVGGNNSFSLAVADLNRDGKPDIVVTNLSTTVGVLLGNGDGTFGPEVSFASGGSISTSVAIADVNGDGKPDLVVTNEEGQVFGGLVDVLLGNGDGTFQPAVTYDSGGGDAWSVVVTDVNGDGKPDLVVANVCSKSTCSTHGMVTVLLGNGDGTFQAAVSYDSGGFQAFSVAVADVNRNGKLDIAVANVQSHNVGVLLGNGDGTFQPAVTYSPGGILGNGPQSVAFADVNGDGRFDLVVADCARGGPSCSSGLVSVLLGNGDGTFQPPVTFSTAGFAAWAVVAADVNGDGKPDLLVANEFSCSSCRTGSVGVLLNNTGSQSPTVTTLASSLNPSIYGQTVTWTAAVTTSGSVLPAGKVNFMWGGRFSFGTATLNSSGVATVTKSLENADTYPLTAVYLGDANNLGSTSTILNQVITQATSSATLSSSPNPSTQGQAVTFTATITSPTCKPTGPVTFTAGKTVLGTAQLANNKAKFTISTLAVGSTTVTATYYGDSNISGSSASVIQTVH